MSVIMKSWHIFLAIAIIVGSMGLPLRNAMSQEQPEEAIPIAANQPSNKREQSEPASQRDILRQQVEVFRIALHGLLEADKKDAAKMLERAIRAREVTLEGRRDDEARQIRERMPNREQLAEILTMSSRLWRKFDNQDNAEIVGQLAREFAGDRNGERERPRTVERRSDVGAGAEEVQRLQNAVRELNGQMADLRREVAEMRRLLRELAEQRREDR